jgi:magnesium-transporting ATPase (P-type)
VLFQGTTVVEGSGRAIVFATGNDNQLAKIMKSTSSVKKPITSLQKEVNIFVRRIAMLAGVTGVVVIAVWAGFLHTRHPEYMNVPTMISNGEQAWACHAARGARAGAGPKLTSPAFPSTETTAHPAAISVIIAFVPEGLPLALSIGLTIIARRMCLRYAVLVKVHSGGTLRHRKLHSQCVVVAALALAGTGVLITPEHVVALPFPSETLQTLGSIETLGSTSFIASDKTGTLTQNKVRSVACVCAGRRPRAILMVLYITYPVAASCPPFARPHPFR